MTQYGAREFIPAPQIVGRSPADYAQGLQDYLKDIQALGDVMNTVLQTMNIQEGGGTVTVEIEGQGGHADVFLLMGA